TIRKGMCQTAGTDGSHVPRPEFHTPNGRCHCVHPCSSWFYNSMGNPAMVPGVPSASTGTRVLATPFGVRQCALMSHRHPVGLGAIVQTGASDSYLSRFPLWDAVACRGWAPSNLHTHSPCDPTTLLVETANLLRQCDCRSARKADLRPSRLHAPPQMYRRRRDCKGRPQWQS